MDEVKKHNNTIVTPEHFIYVRIASCSLSAYTFIMCKIKATYLLTYILTYLVVCVGTR